MAEDTEDKKKRGFFGKLMRIAFVAAIVGAVVVIFGAVGARTSTKTSGRSFRRRRAVSSSLRTERPRARGFLPRALACLGGGRW